MVDLGRLLDPAITPGLLLVSLYLLHILIPGCLRPQDMPPAPADMATVGRLSIGRGNR